MQTTVFSARNGRERRLTIQNDAQLVTRARHCVAAVGCIFSSDLLPDFEKRRLAHLTRQVDERRLKFE
jgi:hypothetical protein